MLVDNYWITDLGSFNMTTSEHAQFAIAVMLNMDIATERVPMRWTNAGVPPEALDKALERGADPRAVQFLSAKRNDARLWVLRELGWVRTIKSRFNLWRFDKPTADLIRNAKDYWLGQYKATEHDMMDVEEFETSENYSISVKRFLEGGDPKILKRLACGHGGDCVEEALEPEYSTAKYGELERRKLYARVGDNPRRGRR